MTVPFVSFVCAAGRNLSTLLCSQCQVSADVLAHVVISTCKDILQSLYVHLRLLHAVFCLVMICGLVPQTCLFS